MLTDLSSSIFMLLSTILALSMASFSVQLAISNVFRQTFFASHDLHGLVHVSVDLAYGFLEGFRILFDWFGTLFCVLKAGVLLIQSVLWPVVLAQEFYEHVR